MCGVQDLTARHVMCNAAGNHSTVCPTWPSATGTKTATTAGTSRKKSAAVSIYSLTDDDDGDDDDEIAYFTVR